jgi:hypothetical protein
MELALYQWGAIVAPVVLGFLVAGLLGGACLWGRRTTALSGFGWLAAGWFIRAAGALPSTLTPLYLRTMSVSDYGRLMMVFNAVGWLINIAAAICLLLGTFRLIEDARRRLAR